MQVLIDSGFTDAYACMPGCHCDNIMIEYNSVLSVQDDLVAQMLLLTESLDSQYDIEVDIREHCQETYDAI